MSHATILTDGGGNAGFGHVTRCLSLAQAFENRGFRVSFVINGDDSVKSILGNRSYHLLTWQEESNRDELVSLLKEADTDIVVVDSYLADYPVYEMISQTVAVPVYLDDNAEVAYPPGLVLNWSIYAPELAYPGKEGVRYLLGPSYLSLRKSFWQVSGKPVPREVQTVMVTFGGDDSKNMTPKVLRHLAETYPGLKKKVVVTAAFRNSEEIEQACDGNSQLIESPDARGMKEIMELSDIAVSSGGQTLYELARVGVPAVVIAVADNQRRNVAGWSKTGFIKDAGYYTDQGVMAKTAAQFNTLLPYGLRKNAVDAGRSLVPENGAQRIINVIEELL